MGLAHEQDIAPKKEEPKSEWTFRRIFPMKATISALVKTFTTPFDVLLFFQIFIIGMSELIGNHVSWMMYLLTALTMFADVLEHQKVPPQKEETKKP